MSEYESIIIAWVKNFTKKKPEYFFYKISEVGINHDKLSKLEDSS